MSGWKWYVRRLRAMTAPEVLYRIQQRLVGELERAHIRRAPQGIDDRSLWRGLGRESAPDWERWREHLGEREWLNDFTWLREPQEFVAAFPVEAKGLSEKADEMLDGTQLLFGHVPVAWPECADWHRDPLDGKRWPPAAFSADIPLRGGGIKSVWELGRHQYLTTLAQAYWITGNDAYLARAVSHLRQWLDQNRPLRGIHWSSGLELGVRLASWWWIYTLTRGTAMDAELAREFTRSIVMHARTIQRHLSRYSSANNHLVGEAFGLWIASELVPEWFEAQRWRSTARAILESEIALQILPDGGSAEQSTHYLGFTTDFCLMYAAVLKGRREALPVLSRLESVGEYVSALIDGRGQLPRIGDEDGGLAFDLAGGPDFDQWRSRLQTIAVICCRPLLAQGLKQDARTWWLTGERSADVDTQVQAVERQFPFQLNESGLALLRSGEGAATLSITFDCGPLGYLSTAAHGHADCLSVWLSRGGTPLLVDSGTYRYHEELDWRAFFRGTSAHNTVAVDGEDQSPQTGSTMWGRRARAQWCACRAGPFFQWAEGQHDGYSRLQSGPVVHRRGVGLVEGQDSADGPSLPYAMVVDRLIGAGSHDVESYFHFPPRARVEAVGASVCLAKVEDKAVAIYSFTPGAFSSVVLCGSDHPRAGWHSARFFQREPAPVWVTRGRVQVPISLLHLLWFSEARPAVQVEADYEAGALTVRIAHAGWADEIQFSARSSADPIGTAVSYERRIAGAITSRLRWR